MIAPTPADKGTPKWPELLGLGLILTIAAHAVPEYAFNYYQFLPDSVSRLIYSSLGERNFFDCLFLAFGLLVCLTAPRRSGLRIGTLRPHHWKVLVIVAVPIVLTAIIYPRLSVKPFADQPVSMWLISPLTQDIIFSGYLYGLFAQRAGRWFSPCIPINPAVLIAAAFFALWHLPNLVSVPVGYVLFQLAYVFIGATWTGMTRVYTGSVFYITISHMAVNYIAWRTS